MSATSGTLGGSSVGDFEELGRGKATGKVGHIGCQGAVSSERPCDGEWIPQHRWGTGGHLLFRRFLGHSAEVFSTFLENVAGQGCLTEQGQLAVWEQSAAKGPPTAKRPLDAAGALGKTHFSDDRWETWREFFSDILGGGSF